MIVFETNCRDDDATSFRLHHRRSRTDIEMSYTRLCMWNVYIDTQAAKCSRSNRTFKRAARINQRFLSGDVSRRRWIAAHIRFCLTLAPWTPAKRESYVNSRLALLRRRIIKTIREGVFAIEKRFPASTSNALHHHPLIVRAVDLFQHKRRAAFVV